MNEVQRWVRFCEAALMGEVPDIPGIGRDPVKLASHCLMQYKERFRNGSLREGFAEKPIVMPEEMLLKMVEVLRTQRHNPAMVLEEAVRFIEGFIAKERAKKDVHQG